MGVKRKKKKDSSSNLNQTKKEAPKLSLVSEPTEFFKEEVSKALETQNLKADPNTEFYLVDLLSRFMFTESLYKEDGESGEKKQEVLALLLAKSIETDDASQKMKGLRRLGDISLYTAGFFGDSLSRKIVDVDYYIQMGRTAYSSLSQLSTSALDSAFQQVFWELGDRFEKFVDVLGVIADASLPKDPKNILRLYEIWLKTRSERAEKSLKEAGILPIANLKPDWQ